MQDNYTRLVGDIHGQFTTYKNLLIGAEKSVQLGDYGLGFNSVKDREMFLWGKDNPQHKFIRGNHDDVGVCSLHENYLGDWWGDYKDKVMYIGGAWSIDYFHRTEGVNWWADEELSQRQFDEAHKVYLEMKPLVVISHDAPQTLPEKMGLLNPDFGGPVITRTGWRLQMMFNQHQPKYWFFGHWHKSAEMQFRGCNFRCLSVNETVDFDLTTLTYKPEEDLQWEMF